MSDVDFNVLDYGGFLSPEEQKNYGGNNPEMTHQNLADYIATAYPQQPQYESLIAPYQPDDSLAKLASLSKGAPGGGFDPNSADWFNEGFYKHGNGSGISSLMSIIGML